MIRSLIPSLPFSLRKPRDIAVYPYPFGGAMGSILKKYCSKRTDSLLFGARSMLVFTGLASVGFLDS